MQFALAKSGMMKVCEGQWTVCAVEGEASSRPLAAQGTECPVNRVRVPRPPLLKLQKEFQVVLCAIP